MTDPNTDQRPQERGAAFLPTFLAKLVPLFKKARRKSESPAAFRKHAEEAEHRAQLLKKKFQQHEIRRVRREPTGPAGGFIHPEAEQPQHTVNPDDLQAPMPFIHPEEPQVPVRSGNHGFWSFAPLGERHVDAIQSPGRAQWFLRWLHLPHLSSAPEHDGSLPLSSTPATSTPVAPPVSARVSNDLDALLQAPVTPAAPVQPPEPPRKKEVANASLMELTMDLPTVKPEKKAPPATPSVSISPATKEVAAKKPEPAAPPKTDIAYKPMVRSQKSGFRDFIGALKTFGLGRQKAALLDNLATMLGAGLPLVDSLKTLVTDTRSRGGRELTKRIVDSVENGSPLWRALEDRHCFSPDVIALVRIGEEAGNLAENMAYLALQQEKDQGLRSKVKMAMIYPSIVMVLMLVIVIGLGMFVLPNLIGVLYSLNVPLPFATRMVIAFTNFFTTDGKFAVPGLVVFIATLIILAKFTRFKAVAQGIMFRIPGIGRLAREATIARFGVILGGLLQAGVPLVDAMKSLADVTSMVAYKAFYTRLLEHINVGDTFSKSFIDMHTSSRLLPLSVQQLVTTGERSGSLSKVLLKIADIYEKKANDTAQKLPVILEPMLLLFIGALVGTIAFAIIVPIYSIVGNVGNA